MTKPFKRIHKDVMNLPKPSWQHECWEKCRMSSDVVANENDQSVNSHSDIAIGLRERNRSSVKVKREHSKSHQRKVDSSLNRSYWSNANAVVRDRLPSDSTAYHRMSRPVCIQIRDLTTITDVGKVQSRHSWTSSTGQCGSFFCENRYPVTSNMSSFNDLQPHEGPRTVLQSAVSLLNEPSSGLPWTTR